MSNLKRAVFSLLNLEESVTPDTVWEKGSLPPRALPLPTGYLLPRDAKEALVSLNYIMSVGQELVDAGKMSAADLKSLSNFISMVEMWENPSSFSVRKVAFIVAHQAADHNLYKILEKSKRAGIGIELDELEKHARIFNALRSKLKTQ